MRTIGPSLPSSVSNLALGVVNPHPEVAPPVQPQDSPLSSSVLTETFRVPVTGLVSDPLMPRRHQNRENPSFKSFHFFCRVVKHSSFHVAPTVQVHIAPHVLSPVLLPHVSSSLVSCPPHSDRCLLSLSLSPHPRTHVLPLARSASLSASTGR